MTSFALRLLGLRTVSSATTRAAADAVSRGVSRHFGSAARQAASAAESKAGSALNENDHFTRRAIQQALSRRDGGPPYPQGGAGGAGGGRGPGGARCDGSGGGRGSCGGRSAASEPTDPGPWPFVAAYVGMTGLATYGACRAMPDDSRVTQICRGVITSRPKETAETKPPEPPKYEKPEL